MHRHITIALGVLVIHIAALWAMQTGLLRRAVEVIVPAEILSELIEPPAPKVVPPPPSPSAPIKQSIKQTVVAKAPIPMETVEPQPLAIADPTPAPNAPVGAIDPPPVVTPVAAPVALAPPAPARVELPSSDADYLQNPAPPYPPLSKRLGEQGKVLVRVLIGVDGTAQKADIKQSSGFERLDQSALSTVLHWRYVPGKRARVPEAMWFNVPINFVLE
ncbi:MAG: energy transducer TonB [Rhodoferax sp.]|jgi:protein TonB|nr:energy transducer TonB [Rhodoferax sp.]MBP8286939.1 energy transducer TonB [Rhodoferax sp.]MBP9059988.1 energy transducer TonB [Rhodoferax sp.]MBP9685161.1 energy transducer TonB [Rhodoferax sp.]